MPCGANDEELGREVLIGGCKTKAKKKKMNIVNEPSLTWDRISKSTSRNLQIHLYRCCKIASAYTFTDVTASVRHLCINCFRTRKAGAHEAASSKPLSSLENWAPHCISCSKPNKLPPSISFTWLLFSRALTAKWWICTDWGKDT